MPLNHCISLSSIDPEDASDIRAAVRAAGGDEATGVQRYIEGIMGDLDNIRGQLAEQGFKGPETGGDGGFLDSIGVQQAISEADALSKQAKALGDTARVAAVCLAR